MAALARVAATVLAVCLLGASMAPAASAQTAKTTAAGAEPAGDSARQYDAAFQDMLRQPANLDVLFKFASIASQTGDLEGAVSALERMLVINPDLPRVRLELGVLYYRLGSYEIARNYLDTALRSADLPPDVRTRAEQFMAEVNKRKSPSRFSGEVFLGMRYQSNANLGPATSSVLLFGQTANLNQSALGAADWGAVSSAQVRHFYDLERQDKATIETQFTAYANRQFQLAAANVTLLDLTTGPRFQILADSFEDISLKPFVSGGMIWINDAPYYASYGGGLETGSLLSERLRNVSVFSWRRHDNQDNYYLPTNSLFRGTELSATTTLQFQLTDIVTLSATGSATRFQAELTQTQSYQLLGIGGGMSFRFADPVLKTGLPWTIGLSVTQQWWGYDQADPVIDPTTQRFQADLIANITLAIPFDERTTFSVTGGRFVRTASIINYAFENNSVMFGIGWRF